MNGAIAGAAAAAAVANAIKASGVLVRVDPQNFRTLLSRAAGAVVVHAQGGMLSTNYQYLLGYKGLAFYTKADEPISMPGDVELVKAEKIWIPG
jgi:hypothetical protein